MESLVDTLAEKATGIILKRTLVFSKYLLWAQHGPTAWSRQGRVEKSTSYQNMIHMRNSGAARTTLRRFLEAA
eukprot:5346366-Amphidinium_carterae.1